jgi:nucleoside phosphorylase
LPIDEGGDPSPESGSRFLDEIYYNPNVNIPIHIIGLTEFDDIFIKYHDQFEDKLWGLINFRVQNNDWEEKLKSKIFYLQNFKTKYVESIRDQNKFDIAIITALNIEFEELISTSEWTKFDIEKDPLVYYSTLLNTKSNNNIKLLACCINQMGMQASSAISSKIISTFSPKNLFITGICAGINKPGVNIGDIIIANQCWDYESGKITDDSNGNLLFSSDMHCIPTDLGILSQLTDFSNNRNILSNIYNEFKGNKPEFALKIHFGSVGSGPYVLSSKQYLKNLISSDRKLLGLDMEGYGIYKASQFHIGTIPVFIKAISDFADSNKTDNYQKYASFVSAKFVIDFIYNNL